MQPTQLSYWNPDLGPTPAPTPTMVTSSNAIQEDPPYGNASVSIPLYRSVNGLSANSVCRWEATTTIQWVWTSIMT